MTSAQDTHITLSSTSSFGLWLNRLAVCVMQGTSRISCRNGDIERPSRDRPSATGRWYHGGHGARGRPPRSGRSGACAYTSTAQARRASGCAAVPRHALAASSRFLSFSTRSGLLCSATNTAGPTPVCGAGAGAGSEPWPLARANAPAAMAVILTRPALPPMPNKRDAPPLKFN